MMFMTFFYIFLIDVRCECKSNDLQFVINFLQYKHITLASYYMCQDVKSTVSLLKVNHKCNMRILTTQMNATKNKFDYFFHRFSFVIDLDCYGWQTILKQKVKYMKFRIQQYGLLVCKSKQRLRFAIEKLKSTNLRLDSNIFVALKSKSIYTVYEFYNPGFNAGGQLMLYNSINYTMGKFNSSGVSTYEMRKDLSSLHLKVAFVVTKNVSFPVEYLKDVRTKQYDTSSKVNFAIFQQMIDIHQYRWNIVATSGWFGSTRRGEEAGLAYVLIQGIADIGGSSGLMTSGRAEAVDFGVGTYLFRTSFIFCNPETYDKHMEKEFMYKPFSPGTWFGAWTCAIVLCISLKFVLLLEKNPVRYSWCTVIIFMISAFCQQGMNFSYNATAGRIVILSSLILTYVLYNYYTSSIVSSVINSKKATFQSPEELVDSNLEIGIESIAYARVLNATNDSLLLRLQKDARSNKSRVAFYQQQIGIEKVRKRNFAYMAEAITAYNDIERTFSNEEICELAELNAARPTLLYIVGKKNGQYNKLFSVRLNEIKSESMHQRAFLGGSGWARGGVAGSGVVRRAHPASGAQWNVQVVRGKVNGKCLWNACKALSLGLLLMVLGAAMATIGYYADHLSIAQEIRGNHTVRVKNESRGFHLNNLSYAGPIVMGVGGFIVVAACVMTFEARDSAAKVVPARFKMSAAAAVAIPSTSVLTPRHHGSYSSGGGIVPGGVYSTHGSLRHSGSQTGAVGHSPADRRILTQSFMQFSRGLAIEAQNRPNTLRVSQGSISKSPSAPDFSLLEKTVNIDKSPPPMTSSHRIVQEKASPKSSRKTFAACALLNPGLLHRHALSVDETAATYRLSHESLHGSGSQGSMALDLHLECPVTLRIRDRRRNPLKRQRRVDEEERAAGAVGQHVSHEDSSSRRSSHSCSPRLQFQNREFTANLSGGSVHQLPMQPSCSHQHSSSKRRSSNASDCTHRSRTRRQECYHHRGRLERAISSDSRLTGAIPKCHHNFYHHYSPIHVSNEQETDTALSDTDVRAGKNSLQYTSSYHSH